MTLQYSCVCGHRVEGLPEPGAGMSAVSFCECGRPFCAKLQEGGGWIVRPFTAEDLACLPLAEQRELVEIKLQRMREQVLMAGIKALGGIDPLEPGEEPAYLNAVGGLCMDMGRSYQKDGACDALIRGLETDGQEFLVMKVVELAGRDVVNFRIDATWAPPPSPPTSHAGRTPVGGRRPRRRLH